jgi:hypothetical protein
MNPRISSRVSNLYVAAERKLHLAIGGNFLISTLLLAGGMGKLEAASDFRIPSGSKVVIGGIELTVPDSETEVRITPASGVRPSTNQKPERGREEKAQSCEGAGRLLLLSGDESGSRTVGKETLSLGVKSSGIGYGDFEKPLGPIGLQQTFSIGAEVGVLSFFSGSIAWRFSDHFGLRGGLNRFAYNIEEDLDDVSYSVKLKMQSEPLLLDFHPWSERSFRLSLGVLFNQNQLSAGATPTGSVEIGNNTYAPGAVGSLSLSIKQRPVSPYLGMGGNLFYFDRNHQWAFTHELGVAWTGKPKVGLSASGTGVPQSDLEKERQKIEDDISKLALLPFIKFGISFTF